MKNKRSTFSKIALFLLLTIAIISGTWTFFLKRPVNNLKNDMIPDNFSHKYPNEKEILNWVLQDNQDSIRYAADKLSKKNPELSKKLRKHLKKFAKVQKERTEEKTEIVPAEPVDLPEVLQETFDTETAKAIIVESENKVPAENTPVVTSTIKTKFLRLKIDNNNVYYVGDIVNGKANGHGKGVWDNGAVYEGDWIDNKRDGKGKHKWPDGEYYEGEFKDDKRYGQGTYQWKNNEKYVGEWVEDMRHGKGTLYDKKGKIKFQGTWKADIFLN